MPSFRRSPRRRDGTLRWRLTAGAFSLTIVLCAAASSQHRAPQIVSEEPGQAVVGRVIDGDTVELEDGRLVRYIGIDTPEMRRKRAEAWVLDPEPYAQAAKEANQALVDQQAIRLELDVEARDRYGRLLAYVYVGDMFVNEELLRQGMAQAMTIPPNVRYADRFRAVAAEARREKRGLWNAPQR